MQKFLTIISAINDESRVLILHHLLRYKELCVCDLQELLNMGQSRLSRHLKILKDAGFYMSSVRELGRIMVSTMSF